MAGIDTLHIAYIVHAVQDVIIALCFTAIAWQFYSYGRMHKDTSMRETSHRISAVFFLTGINSFFWHFVSLFTGNDDIEVLRVITMAPLLYCTLIYATNNHVAHMVMTSINSLSDSKERDIEYDVVLQGSSTSRAE